MLLLVLWARLHDVVVNHTAHLINGLGRRHIQIGVGKQFGIANPWIFENLNLTLKSVINYAYGVDFYTWVQM